MAITEVQRWTRKWRIKLNKTKSVHIDFTNQHVEQKPICINHHAVPYENTAKYLGMTLDTKLRWKPHVKKEQEELKSEIQKNALANGSLLCPIYIQ
jgi:predicted GIY-YIG superfamily endonuclease